MLFNSYEFIFAFLPVTLALWWWLVLAGRHGNAQAWLVLASLFFYAWWNPIYLPLILGSMTMNFMLGLRLMRSPSRGLLAIGVCLNLLLLGGFKYTDFLLQNLNLALTEPLPLTGIVLPLAISFFTFQQIAFLVDSQRGLAAEPRPLQYALFVTFFPQLIAGPIVHHAEMMPQFARRFFGERWRHVSVGISIFTIGLAKKVLLADTFAGFATPVFDAAAQGHTLTAVEAWGGALAYTLQLYFDFSGYSDMAIGLARMFGIRLPVNFASPYKARNIAEFWRRWHMTLSRFLRDYLYIPLGGNRRGRLARYRNLLVTMLLGGLWHGAGWTFVLWGLLHGIYLITHRAWRRLKRNASNHQVAKLFASALTFVAVVIGWVFFRAQDVESALRVLHGMAGLEGPGIPISVLGPLASFVPGEWTRDSGLFEGLTQFGWLGAGLAIVFFAPNTQTLMRRYRPALGAWFEGGWPPLRWRIGTRHALFIAVLFVLCVLSLLRPSEFIYFQF
ncbi:MAG: MBOAT family protein [Chromatiales bacterium]|nr:MBOAT family protein [Chromatiales bacterium]